MCERAEELLAGALARMRCEVVTLAQRCESPIEEIILVSLWALWRCKVGCYGMHATLEDGPLGGGRCGVVVETQKPVHTAPASYRADFFVYLVRPEDVQKKLYAPLVVEVDGHSFHDRTKAQATRDRERDRHVLAEGISTGRFTGREVYREPGRCAAEIDGLMRKSAHSTTEP